MKESIGVVGVFQIVILFILLFTGIMCLTINNTNAFAVKNNLLNTIVSLNGNYKDGEKLKEEMVSVINDASYRNTGKCEDGYDGYDKEGNPVKRGNAALCIKEVDVHGEANEQLNSMFENKIAKDDIIPAKYYKVMVFYQLDIPVIKQIFNLKNVGETRIIYNGGVS